MMIIRKAHTDNIARGCDLAAFHLKDPMSIIINRTKTAVSSILIYSSANQFAAFF
jgi:hypothetical protein